MNVNTLAPGAFSGSSSNLQASQNSTTTQAASQQSVKLQIIEAASKEQSPDSTPNDDGTGKTLNAQA